MKHSICEGTLGFKLLRRFFNHKIATLNYDILKTEKKTENCDYGDHFIKS